MISSGKKVSLLSVVAVAAAAAVFFAKKPATDAPLTVRGEQRDGLARRLPAGRPAASGVQHVLKAHEDSGMRAPTASTPGSADPRVGLELSPNAATGYGRSFNPAGALLAPRNDVAESALEFAADRGPQMDFAAATSSQPRTHVVVDGDNLTGLATRYLGSSDRYREIFAANRRVLTTPDLLPIGATLEIPPLDSGAILESVSPATSAPAANSPTANLPPATLPAAGLPATNVVPVPKGALRGDDD